MTTPREILHLSHQCASNVYGTRQPSHLYAVNVALLLAGTAATESHLKHRRQVGYTMSDNGGAWGLWQTEAAPLIDNINYLKRRQDVARRAEAFLFPHGGDLDYIFNTSSHCLTRLCAGWDRFACLMARIHYMRFPEAVPGNDEARAVYYKKYYNTVAGKGTPQKYLEDYHRLISPALKAGL